MPTLASATATEVRLTLPVLVTRKLYGTVSPASGPLASRSSSAPAVLARVIPGTFAIGVSVVSVPVTGAPVGGVPETVALLGTWPASTSAWVSV